MKQTKTNITYASVHLCSVSKKFEKNTFKPSLKEKQKTPRDIWDQMCRQTDNTMTENGNQPKTNESKQ